MAARITSYATIMAREPQRFSSPARFVAFLDILGMKAWLESAEPENIATTMHQAFTAMEQSSMGEHPDYGPYGPVIHSTQFSDSILLWSPDDSWTSLYCMIWAVKMITTIALSKHVSLRGAVTMGECVCDPKEQIFVGPPIGESYLWAEKNRPYRSVGVDFTPQLIDMLQAKLISDPPDSFYDDEPEYFTSLFSGEIIRTNSMIWYENHLFVNHWTHAVLLRWKTDELMLIRGRETESVQRKIEEAEKFRSFESGIADRIRQEEFENIQIGPGGAQDYLKSLAEASQLNMRNADARYLAIFNLAESMKPRIA